MSKMKDAAIDAHNKYEGMSVRELVREIVREESLAHDCGVTGNDWTTLVELESALRKAVIREASVATLDSKENEEGLRWILVHTDIAPKFEYTIPSKEKP